MVVRHLGEEGAEGPVAHFDVLVLGGGPCGLRAALTAAAAGRSVALLDPAETLTGAPTGAYGKCLRAAALAGARSWPEVQETVQRTIKSAQQQAARLLQGLQVTVLQEKGRLVDVRSVEAARGQKYTADAVIIATGSVAQRAPPADFTLPGVFDEDSIVGLQRLPRRVVVQGAGMAGLEFALIFARLGAQVALLEAADRLLPALDPALRQAMKSALAAAGVELLLSTQIARVAEEPGSSAAAPALRVEAAGRVFGCDTLLCACGRQGRLQDLGLENVQGIKVEDGVIAVDGDGCTGVEGVYAVGDVAKGSMGLATMGQAQAERAVRAVLGRGSTGGEMGVRPAAIWSIPEMAWAGLTEEEARGKGLEVAVATARFEQTVRACVTGEEGFLKLVFERRSGRIVGVHIFGEQASELVNYGAEAVREGATIFALLRFVFPAVTYHGLYSQAAAEGKLLLRGECMASEERRKPACMGLPWSSARYDAVVLGAGPVGLKAAAEIGARGRRVALVEPQASIHGAPTGAHSKCLREAVIQGARTWGEVQEVLARAMGNAESEAARLLSTFQVELLRGSGTVVDAHTVRCTDGKGRERELRTEAIVIATGSHARRPADVDFSLWGIYDSDTVQALDRIPRRLVVQGAGLIGIEYALIFARLGSAVSLVEASSAWLQQADVSVQETIREELEAAGVEILLGRSILSITAAEGSTREAPIVNVDLGGRVLQCDALLSACGRQGNIAGLNLEALQGLRVAGQLIEVDDTGYTGCAKVYAVGDCATGAMGLATMGQQQAVLAARALFSKSGLMRTEKVLEHKPCALWTVPEVAWAGLTEEQARRRGHECAAVKVAFPQTLKGCLTKRQGFLKLLFEKGSGRVLGCHLFGESSCELVNFGAELLNACATVRELLHFVFPAATYHELYHQAAAEAVLSERGALHL